MKQDPWHYPRGELAAHMLKVMDSGLVPRIAIFAPRRRGKTWFVLRDLAPAAVKKGYIPVFASLWRTPDKPQMAITMGMNVAIEALKKNRIPWTEYLSRMSSVGVSVAGIGGSVGITRAHKPSPEELFVLGESFSNLIDVAGRKRRRILLLIDEAQHLATRKAFESIAKSLRTTMEGIEATQPEAMRTLFTGSSQTDLAALLEHRNAAFYRSFESQELPDLNQNYTDFVAAQLKTLGRVKVSADTLWEVFNKFDRSPYYMKLLIRELMLRRATTVEEACQIVTENILNNPQLIARWEALSAIEKAVFKRICNRTAIYSNEAVEEFQAELGQSVDASKLQSVVRSLTRKRLISSRSRGEYRSEDPELLNWICNREE